MKSPVKPPTLSDLKAFIAVAEQRSFRRAADFSGVTRSTLSHAIRGLEARLGVRLLHRTTRSVALTEAGEMLLRRIAPHLSGLEQALEEIADTCREEVMRRGDDRRVITAHAVFLDHSNRRLGQSRLDLLGDELVAHFLQRPNRLGRGVGHDGLGARFHL